MEKQKQDALRSELASELAARNTTTLINRYSALMQEELQSNFIAPIGAAQDSSAEINIQLDEAGNVLSSRIVRGSGNFAYDQAVLAAVGKSSPLPMPKDAPEVNKRLRDINITANF